MDMKDRVDGFLKVAAERISADMSESDIRWQLNDLMGSLMELLDNEKDKDRLEREYKKILRDNDIARWDERFLRVISGDDERSQLMVERRANQTPQRVRQGAPITYPTITGTGTTLTMPKGAGAGATWVTNTTAKELEELRKEVSKLSDERQKELAEKVKKLVKEKGLI